MFQNQMYMSLIGMYMYKIPKVIGKLLKFVEAIIGNIENSLHIITWTNINTHTHTYEHTYY